jgi:hypothetical protein
MFQLGQEFAYPDRADLISEQAQRTAAGKQLGAGVENNARPVLQRGRERVEDADMGADVEGKIDVRVAQG